MHACRHVCIFILCMNVYFEAYIQHVLEPSRALIISLLTVADADGGNSLFVSAAIIATMKQTKMKLLTIAMLEVALTLLMMIQVNVPSVQTAILIDVDDIGVNPGGLGVA